MLINHVRNPDVVASVIKMNYERGSRENRQELAALRCLSLQYVVNIIDLLHFLFVPGELFMILKDAIKALASSLQLIYFIYEIIVLIQRYQCGSCMLLLQVKGVQYLPLNVEWKYKAA